jgi:hypothetical protein
VSAQQPGPPHAYHPAGAPAPPGPPHPPSPSKLGIIALVIGLIALVLSVIPLFGFVGLLAVLLGTVELIAATNPNRPQAGQRGKAIAGIITGLLGSAGASLWVYLIATSSCPHVYAYDGTSYQLDADPLSGSFLEAGESTDWDRLEHLAAVDGEYRLRIANERKELDYVDAISLLVVDHRADSEVLPTQQGRLLELAELQPPVSAIDRSGRNVLDAIERDDDQSYVTRLEDVPKDSAGDPVDWLTVEFPRPRALDSVLVLRGRGTEFAAEAFAAYLAEMGPGLGALMDLAQCSESYPYRQRVADEIRRLGLVVPVEVWDGQTWKQQAEIEPIGLATMRSQAIPLALPDGPSDTVRVRLKMTPMFCEIDQLLLAQSPIREATPDELVPSKAAGAGGPDPLERLIAGDGYRVLLRTDETVDVSFAASPVPSGRQRTIVLQIRGYYSFDIGGRAWLSPLAIMRHRSGSDSLPRFAMRMKRAAGSR